MPAAGGATTTMRIRMPAVHLVLWLAIVLVIGVALGAVPVYLKHRPKQVAEETTEPTEPDKVAERLKKHFPSDMRGDLTIDHLRAEGEPIYAFVPTSVSTSFDRDGGTYSGPFREGYIKGWVVRVRGRKDTATIVRAGEEPEETEVDLNGVYQFTLIFSPERYDGDEDTRRAQAEGDMKTFLEHIHQKRVFGFHAMNQDYQMIKAGAPNGLSAPPRFHYLKTRVYLLRENERDGDVNRMLLNMRSMHAYMFRLPHRNIFWGEAESATDALKPDAVLAMLQKGQPGLTEDEQAWLKGMWGLERDDSG